MIFSRTFLVGAVLGAAFVANAQSYVYSDLASSDTTLTGHSGTQTLTVGGGAIGPNGTTGLLDFFPTMAAVGGSTGVDEVHLLISYASSSDVAARGVGLVLQGTIFGGSAILLHEQIFDQSNTLIGEITNTLYTDHTDQNHGQYTRHGDTFTYVDNTLLSENVLDYHVEKTFFLDADSSHGEGNFASLGVIEQNRQPVPEPASVATLGIGALCLYRRRQRG